MTDISIVIASQDAGATIADCLSSLTRQAPDGGAAEIIVVDNSRDRSALIVEEQFPGVRLMQVPGRALLPELWARGTEDAAGQVVAFTTAHCVPDADWIAEILRHHASSHAGVGGAIENAQPSTATQWAIYFCRYAGYMPPFPPHTADQIAGDNASYKRWVLEAHADLIKTGFWENVINERLCRDGHTLLLTPAVRATHGRAFGPWAFCRQRLTHGRIFGEQRAAAASGPRRALYLVLSPIIPVVFLGKITRNVLANGRHTGAFVRALPLLILFVLSWSAGEVLGYVRGWLRHATGAPVAPQVDPLVRR